MFWPLLTTGLCLSLLRLESCLNVKCPSQAHVFEHWAASRWCYFRNLWNLQEVKLCWRKSLRRGFEISYSTPTAGPLSTSSLQH